MGTTVDQLADELHIERTRIRAFRDELAGDRDVVDDSCGFTLGGAAMVRNLFRTSVSAPAESGDHSRGATTRL